MLRPTTPADTDALVAITDATGFFKPHEIDTLREVFDEYHAESQELGHACRTWDDAGAPAGFVYYAPAPMTDRTWELWWIVVDKGRQGRGLGGQLLAAVEVDVRRLGGRLLLIETSSQPLYEPTRRFYLKNGYDREAVLRDFYRDGDDLVVFRKRLTGRADAPEGTT